MRVPDILNPANEDCVSHFPFTVIEDTEPHTITGEGRVDCHFRLATEVCTLHAVMGYAIALGGKILSGEAGGKRLLAELIVDGSLSNYFSDCPPDAIVPFTEANPFVWNDKGPLSLEFEYVDGATITVVQKNPLPADSTSPSEINRVFILRLTK